ncbi:MAG: oligosaccharide flippase family protein [Eudoraea sp.]|nr:oligosaccharide flippase family protein [Eudoraea sp.]
MIKSLLKHPVFKNFLALSTLQIINLILPFVTLPYLARVLGVSNYGVVVMVYSVMQLLFVVNDYGFNLSATKEISAHRNDLGKVNTIFSSIMITKVIMLVISFLILLVLLNTVDVLRNNQIAYLMGFGMVLGQSFTPVWLFQGMERMKYITLANLLSKGSFTALIFVFISQAEHYIYVPLLYSIGFTLAGVMSMILAFKEFGIMFKWPGFNNVIMQIKKSAQYFYSRAAISAYTTANNFIVGVVLGEYFAGLFGVAEKLYQAMVLIYTPLSDAMYPHMVKKKDLNMFKKVFVGVILLNLVVASGVFIFSDTIVHFVFGQGYDESASLLRYFCILAIIIVPTIFIGYPMLGAFGFEKHANYSVVIASIVHFVIILFFHSDLTIYNMVILLIFTQCIVFSLRGHGVYLLIKERAGKQTK